jgi:hypothetical protein
LGALDEEPDMTQLTRRQMSALLLTLPLAARAVR